MNEKRGKVHLGVHAHRKNQNPNRLQYSYVTLQYGSYRGQFAQLTVKKSQRQQTNNIHIQKQIE